MKTITLLNEKGGVGKTTLATHIAAGLAIRGHRVVLIDADPQGSATSLLGLHPEPALYDLLVRDAPWGDCIRAVPTTVYAHDDYPLGDNLFAVVPSNAETRNIANSISDVYDIRRRLYELKSLADWVIIDTSPTPSLLHGSILLATDSVILPTQLEALSLESLNNTIAHLERFSAMRKGENMGAITIMGIVPALVRMKTVQHQDLLEFVQDTYPRVWAPIAQRITWGEAALHKQMVWRYAPGSGASRDADTLITQLGAGISG